MLPQVTTRRLVPPSEIRVNFCPVVRFSYMPVPSLVTHTNTGFCVKVRVLAWDAPYSPVPVWDPVANRQLRWLSAVPWPDTVLFLRFGAF